MCVTIYKTYVVVVKWIQVRRCFNLVNQTAMTCLVLMICLVKFTLSITWKPKYLVEAVGRIFLLSMNIFGKLVVKVVGLSSFLLFQCPRNIKFFLFCYIGYILRVKSSLEVCYGQYHLRLKIG